MSRDDVIIDLEIRLAYQEDALNQLNDVIARQDSEILLLREQMRALLRRVEDLARVPAPGESGMVDERPPHY